MAMAMGWNGRRWIVLGALVALLLGPTAGALRADPIDVRAAGKDPLYVQAAELVGKGQYEQALPLLQQVVGKNPDDADAYNLLGFSTRKLGHPEQALAFYLTALRLNPEHRGAHEYLGEAYLELGQLDKAREQLAYLDKDCWLGCEEYSDLKKAVAKYEAGQGR
jgi:tetratricopeptide (TPR) repeat protein